MGQEFSDFCGHRETAAGCPSAAYTVVHASEMTIDEMAAMGVFSSGGKFVGTACINLHAGALYKTFEPEVA